MSARQIFLAHEPALLALAALGQWDAVKELVRAAVPEGRGARSRNGKRAWVLRYTYAAQEDYLLELRRREYAARVARAQAELHEVRR